MPMVGEDEVYTRPVFLFLLYPRQIDQIIPNVLLLFLKAISKTWASDPDPNKPGLVLKPGTGP